MDDCLFCKIVRGEIPANVVHESEGTLAFRDIAPKAPVHVLVIPKLHYANVAELGAADPVLGGEVLAAVDAVAQKEGVRESFRVVFNTGPAMGQTVFHVHAHVLGGGTTGFGEV
ncbi:MAG TPA: histidine triad nucleotide-binding protein [Candidatus Limnocylindrales bacterium]